MATHQTTAIISSAMKQALDLSPLLGWFVLGENRSRLEAEMEIAEEQDALKAAMFHFLLVINDACVNGEEVKSAEIAAVGIAMERAIRTTEALRRAVYAFVNADGDGEAEYKAMINASIMAVASPLKNAVRVYADARQKAYEVGSPNSSWQVFLAASRELHYVLGDKPWHKI